MKKYFMIFSIVIAIIILLAGFIGFIKIRKKLQSELYGSSMKFNMLSNVYIALIIYFFFAYTAYIIAWGKYPLYDYITYLIFFLLFFGSIFVGLSVWVLSYSINVAFGVQLNELDTMTGLKSKNSFEMMAQKILDEGHENYILAVIDMDNFKRINDLYGHVKGDEVIRITAEIIQNSVRSNDMVGRFGGDEFLILFYGIKKNQIEAIVARIEQAIVAAQKERGCHECSAISYGIAELNGGSGGDYQDIFNRADQALYDMKKQKKRE